MKNLIALIAVIFAVNVQAGEYPDISIADLEKAIKSGKVAVIDVNGANSYAKRGHIPGACPSATRTRCPSSSPKWAKTPSCGLLRQLPLPAYKRGASAAEELGFKNVKHLSAGIAGWLKAGKKVEKN